LEVGAGLTVIRTDTVYHLSPNVSRREQVQCLIFLTMAPVGQIIWNLNHITLYYNKIQETLFQVGLGLQYIVQET
jgi:hypothetical protein